MTQPIDAMDDGSDTFAETDEEARLREEARLNLRSFGELQVDSFAVSEAHGFHDNDDFERFALRLLEGAGVRPSSTAREALQVLVSGVGPVWEELQVTKRLLLIVSEISEAFEELRVGHKVSEEYESETKPGKPEGIPSELADAVIRIADLVEAHGGRGATNLGHTMAVKQRYNESRARMHGKRF